MAEKIFRLRELRPHLGQEGGAVRTFCNDDAINIWPQFGDKIIAISVLKLLRFGKDADLYFNRSKLIRSKRSKTWITKGRVDGIFANPVNNGAGSSKGTDTPSQLSADGQGDKNPAFLLQCRFRQNSTVTDIILFNSKPERNHGARQTDQRPPLLLRQGSLH